MSGRETASRPPATAGEARTDPYWQEVARLLGRLPLTGRTVLLPSGDWSISGIDPQYYRHDEVVSSDVRCDVIVVNKATIPSFAQAFLRRVLAEWNYIFGNAVFCVFARRFADLRGDPEHLTPITTYVDPRRLWRDRPWRCSFIHIPKAAGTSIWRHMAERIPSNIYFQSNGTLRAFDGDINDFELVGGHIHAETLRDVGRIGHAFTVLREPAERALSFIAHARRLAGYAGTLDPSFLLAREADRTVGGAFRDQLLVEANQQVAMLGLRDDESNEDAADLGRALARALSRLSDPSWTVGIQDDSARLTALAAAAFHVDVGQLERLNQTEGRAGLVEAIAPAVHALHMDAGTLCCDDMLFKVAQRMRASFPLGETCP